MDFISAQSASGRVLLSTTILAVIFANSFWSEWHSAFLHLELGLTFNGVEFTMSLQYGVNDGLMALFFFLLGLELKRELLVGKLSDLKSASSVMCAAVGGMTFPAIIFLALANSPEIQTGWAIPVATNTAFALMILVLLGDRIPASARAFLVGLAIVDDIGAILIIAAAYTENFQSVWLIPTGITIVGLATLNLIGVRNGIVYFVVGVVLWFLMRKLALHDTLAGVVAALMAPVRPAKAKSTFTETLKEKANEIEEDEEDIQEPESILEKPKQKGIAHDVINAATEATTPLDRWERRLGIPVSLYRYLPL